MNVTALENGAQEVVLSTNAPGRLLLHWGVEGGKRYKGGWRLPGDSSRPEGTVEYKKRALQSPFKSSGDSSQEIRLQFYGDEASDHLNFVLKDTASDRWYDLNGANFQIPLRQMEPGDGRAPSQPSNGNNGNGSSTSNGVTASSQPQVVQEDLLPMEQIAAIPQDLSGVWAYMKWEAAGYPARSKEEADSEYEASLRELALLLRRRISLSDLQSVANEGVNRYISFTQEVKNVFSSATSAPPQQAQQQQQEQRKEEQKAPSSPEEDIMASLPEGLVGLKAYLMWEAAGKPDGADFAVKAKEFLANEVVKGKSLEQLENEMRNGGSQQQKQQEQQAAASAPPPPPPRPAPVEEVQQPIVVGESIHMRQRNPLDLIHRSAPPRLVEKAKKRETPLEPLLAIAQEDQTSVWHRVSLI